MKRGLNALWIAASAGLVSPALAQDLPGFDKVSDGFEAVVSTADGARPMWNVWKRAKDGQLLAELPRGIENRRFYITPTVAGGDAEAGVDNRPTFQVYWRRIENQMVLIEPNTSVRTTGDAESQLSTQRVYTDRVVLSVPVIANGPSGGTVIDLDGLLVGQAGSFFGPYTAGANTRLTVLKSVKAFPYNLEVEFELPRGNGQLMAIHYSIGDPPKTPGFRTREADRRVGFFYTNFTDRGANDGESQTRRLAHRWALEKRDPKLAMSPPKQPIIYYIEHTTPVRYRRWVRDAILEWNKAFEQVGILNAIEVRQQDASTGAYMDIDPEDMRYSFIRWTNSHMGYAIGPSNAHPETGEIYNADIVMDEGFISGFARQYSYRAITAAHAVAGMDPETIAWLDENPGWDPRMIFATTTERREIESWRAARAAGLADEVEVPHMLAEAAMMASHDPEDCNHGMCRAAYGQGLNIDLMRIAADASLLPAAEGGSVLDGLPEEFIGPQIKWVLMHEVGHTLGLMHNFKGTSVVPYAQANSEAGRGTPWSVSVMDYPGFNLVVEEGGLVQGDFSPSGIGTYDMWAIKWGYTSDQKQADELARQAADPANTFMSDEGNSGPDPRARTWDMGENSLDFCDNQIRLANRIRSKIIDELVKDGQTWQRAARAYNDSMSRQMQAMSIASGWIGGVYLNRFHKGDANATDPITPAPMDRQRRAIKFIIENGLRAEAYGLTPELLAKFGSQQWWDEGGFSQPDMPVNDQIFNMQSSALTMLLNPTRLRRVMDNEFRVGAGQDALTVPELMRDVRAEVWNGLDAPRGSFTERSPFISSFKRNLQREHLTRVIDLANGRVRLPGATGASIPSLARQELRDVQALVVAAVARGDLDTYSKAHLIDCVERIDLALKAQFLRQD